MSGSQDKDEKEEEEEEDFDSEDRLSEVYNSSDEVWEEIDVDSLDEGLDIIEVRLSLSLVEADNT
jgi:hypothetical protein